VDFFFEPKGIAVAGATPDPNAGGHHLLANLTLGYRGPIYPVNPKYDDILGMKCYSRVSEIDGTLDLVLIFVPARAVPQVLEDCVAKGVRGAIIQSGGFAEVGPEGKALQDRCLAIARGGALRLWGPNCMGFIDTWKRHVFSFITTEGWKDVFQPGEVSLIVQSGLLSAGFIIALMSNRTVGLAKVCSIGNKCDVEETELLGYLLQDPATKVICLYLESFVQGRRFLELAAASDKPIVVLKGGKTPSGAVAVASHTASLAGNDDLIQGALRQAGVYQADDFFEMIDMARVLGRPFAVHPSRGERAGIAVLSYSGASAIVTADHLEKRGLGLASLSASTLDCLQSLSPHWMPIQNPVDFWPAIEKHGVAATYKKAIKALHEDPQVDGLIVHLFSGLPAWSIDVARIVPDLNPPLKPILFWTLGERRHVEETRRSLEELGWPVFDEIQRMVRVMACLFESRPKTGRPSWMDPDLTPPVPDITRSLDALALQADRRPEKILDEHESKKWLSALGLKVVRETLIQNLEQALKAADETGYPVALKGRVEGKAHKTEAGLVKLNLWTPDQLTSAYHEMSTLPARPRSFLVQPMLRGELELIVGITRDPQFGAAVMLGLGGVWTEVYRDVVFRLAPLGREDVLEMVSELRGQILFKGFRGSKPVEMDVLGDWLIRLGWLALTYPQIREIDVNPLLVVDGEPVAVDATLLLR